MKLAIRGTFYLRSGVTVQEIAQYPNYDEKSIKNERHDLRCFMAGSVGQEKVFAFGELLINTATIEAVKFEIVNEVHPENELEESCIF